MGETYWTDLKFWTLFLAASGLGVMAGPSGLFAVALGYWCGGYVYANYTQASQEDGE